MPKYTVQVWMLATVSVIADGAKTAASQVLAVAKSKCGGCAFLHSLEPANLEPDPPEPMAKARVA